MSTIFIAAWNNGAMRMKASVTAEGNMHGMTTGMAFMKYTSTPWKAFGPCCGRGFARIAVSHRIICRSMWASLNLFTIRDDGAKRYWELCWRSCSRSSPESILSLQHYLTRILEQAHRFGEKPVTPTIVHATLAPDMHELEPTLMRYGYNAKALSELLHIRQAEVRAF